MTDAPDDLATVKTLPTAFEAHTIAVVLREAGIEAFVFDAVHRGLPMGGDAFAVPVQVRHADLERATQVLEATVADSVDIDWDEVNLGEREDALPPNRPGRMPLPARATFVIAVIAVILGLALLVLTVF